MKSKVLTLYANRHSETEWTPWPVRDKIILGLYLIEIVIATTTLIEKRTIIAKKKETVIYLAPTPATLDYVEGRNRAVELLQPLYEPMIVLPKSWSDPYHGGYLTSHVRPLRLIKSRFRAARRHRWG